ncbi:MAG: Asp-tRNA(Asn)/Glu-tRNA(Gln) amidotransferase GatCAB subunit C [Rhodobacteraceae bacterium]|nr:Asp-tRNA(Asn)/Glu-tRNA(Gln) amidotransferase GatCAB subunit C [Paracoccaceae bacterium]
MPDTSLPTRKDLLTSTHWGTYRVETENGRITAMRPLEADPDPSPIGPGILDVLDGPTRIKRPAVRQSWLDHGPGARGDLRGEDPFVEVSWDEAERLVADELNRVRTLHGNEAIYAGSYGWASAGRFHHAQSNLKRFLNCIGGFTRSVNTYSFAAGEVIVPHVMGHFYNLVYDATSWRSVIADTDLFVAFGGVPIKNGQIAQGGVGRHVQAEAVRAAAAAGVQFVNISPLRSDVMEEAGAEWLAPRPSTDTALMLALCQTLLAEGLHDGAFLARYTTGFDRFAAYLTGASDGVVKDADWAAPICDLAPDVIRDLARRMASNRTMISISWSLTRQDHGEMAYWAAIALASMVGQIGLPGGGIGFGYSAVNAIGNDLRDLPVIALPQGRNAVDRFVPVARVTDMLENPGGGFEFDGQSLTYPDVKLVWWAGGNPFHHHQDLNRMRRAWAKPETVIVNEWCWNALAKHADIVLPCTTHLERDDLALTNRDPWMVRMDKAVEPPGEARDDHAIFAAIAAKLGVEEAFTEGRTPEDWLRWIYDRTRQNAAAMEIELPSLDELREKGVFEVPATEKPHVMLEGFRADPEGAPLATPSGRIELFSDVIAGFGYDDCPPHPAWLEPVEWLGQGTGLHLMSNQPKGKLHSQLDHGAYCRSLRPDDREVLTLHPGDAAARGIAAGDRLRVFNDRGWCLATAALSDGVRPGVVQMSTGAWFDPAVDDQGRPGCRHGNPNVLTLDKGTSRLGQGPIAHSCMVEVERDTSDMVPAPFEPPVLVQR